MADLSRIQASNIVSYKERSLKAKIDPELPIRSVIQQLSSAFKTSEPYSTLALRDDSDHLLTDLNLPQCVSSGTRLKLVSSPTIEALDTISALDYALKPLTPLPSSPSGRMVVPLKLSLFHLQKFIREDEFAKEFLLRGGMRLLVELLLVRRDENEIMRGSFETSPTQAGERATGHSVQLTGNTLAYALQGIDTIMELEAGWDGLTDEFIQKICELITTSRHTNIYRPSCSILHHLLAADPALRLSSKSLGKLPSNSPLLSGPLPPLYGFIRVYSIMGNDTACLNAVTKRMEGDDLQSAGKSLELVNGLMRLAPEGEEWLTRLLGDMEACRVRQAVQRLMPLHESTDLTPHILTFQSAYLKTLLWSRSRAVDAEDPGMSGMLRKINERAGIDLGGVDGDGRGRLHSSSVLGLDCLSRYVESEEELLDILDEQAARGPYQLSLSHSSDTCLDLLLRCYTKRSESDHLQDHLEPFLLGLVDRLHRFVLNAYVRIWTDSRAAVDSSGDIQHISNLVYSHLESCLEHQDRSSWFKLEERFKEGYEVIVERFAGKREKEDKLKRNGGVVAAREEMRLDVLGFIRQQRLDRMKQGTWFSPGVLINTPFTGLQPNPSLPHRFALLSTDLKTILWGDFPSPTSPSPPDHFSLPNIITLSNVTSLQPCTCRPVSMISQAIPSQTSFSLLSGNEKSALDVVARDNSSWAEWVDGLRYLFKKTTNTGDGNARGGMGGEETEEYDDPEEEIQGLTKVSRKYVEGLVDLGLRLRLLDVEGERLYVPESVLVGASPESIDFYYA